MSKKFEEVTKFLMQGGSYTTQQLSQRFNVNIKTIQNYVKLLKKTSGLQKKKTYYSFPDEFRNIDIHEQVQMSTALMIALYKTAIPELKESVSSNFTHLPKELNAFLFDIEFETIDNQPLFNQIVNAIIEQRTLNFNYMNTNNIGSNKDVLPLRVANFNGYWYLIAYDLQKLQLRTLYIKSIADLHLKEEIFLEENELQKLKTEASNINSVWFTDSIKSVKLIIKGEALRYVKRKPHSMLNIEKEEVDYLLVIFKYYNDIEVLNFVKKWLPEIQIINNPKLSQKLTNILQNYLKTT